MRLYMKIFLWFWLAMILVGGALVFATYETQSELFKEGEEATDRTLTPPYAERWAAVFEKHDMKTLENFNAHSKGIARVYFLTEDGKEQLGQTPPPDSAEVWQAARDTDEAQVLWGPTRRYVAQRTTGPSGTHYILLVQLTSPFVRFISGGPYVQSFRLIIAALVGGLFCLWLARYITAPVTELRSVTRELASGNLRSRAAKAALRRNDEIADLSRDFNLMAERIESLMASQRQLIQSVSHELRSPLARLNVALGIAYRHADSQVQAPLERIEREAGRLNDLIGDLLKLARWESGIGPVEKSDIQLDALVRDIAADADFEARSVDRAVQVRTAESCSIEGVRELLHSAIENVMRNAVKYTRPDTEVEVSLEHCSTGSENFAVIRVRDHGDGVPEEALKSLFKPFYRVESARDRASGGTGLGLAIAETAVRLHGGRVIAQNSPEGGLVIEIRLPLNAGKETETLETRAEMQRVFAN
jgi:two-component system sensor histidine kinase CpxA